MDRTAQIICVWSAVLMVGIFVVGFIGFAGFIPPIPPATDARAVAAFFSENTTSIRIGMVLTMISMSLILPWGASVAAQLRAVSDASPVLTYIQIGGCAVGTLIAFLPPLMWETVAFRPDVLHPDAMQVMNDLAWMIWVTTWPPYAVWAVAMAANIFADRRAQPLYPRWYGYFTLWIVLLWVPACIAFFVKHGPFAWNGLLAFYMPITLFFVWVVALTAPAAQALLAGRRQRQRGNGLGAHMPQGSRG